MSSLEAERAAKMQARAIHCIVLCAFSSTRSRRNAVLCHYCTVRLTQRGAQRAMGDVLHAAIHFNAHGVEQVRRGLLAPSLRPRLCVGLCHAPTRE